MASRPDQATLLVKKTLRRRLKEVAAKLDTSMELLTEQALEIHLSNLEQNEVVEDAT